ncbi:hypothetical protein [Thermoflexibacter ruber]|uniref:Uncharacterized protein n=1 Tax=Thermoflexibacter ruber TaxID=1003 RepID=A0A1I2BSB9_9BACT|nr:hypothetical protein [Thermoflexibacter ruber]SFE58975.1 hypothetical protein SAMN04488541_1003136 [Thermoflexibacter ruber]
MRKPHFIFSLIVAFALFLFTLSFPITLSFAQSNVEKFKNLAVGKHWGMRYFIEKYPVKNEKESRKILAEGKKIIPLDGKPFVIDTLIRVYDCLQEYLQLRANNTFASTNVEEGGTWATEGTDRIIFRKRNGAKYISANISFVSEDSLVLIDEENPNDVFIQIFKVCKDNDSTFIDSREVYKVWNIWGIIGGYQRWEQNGLIELGLTRWKQFEWNRVIYAFSANVEIDPINSMHGASVNLWTEDKFFAYGIAATAHSDFKDFFVGIKPMAGFSFNRLFSNSGYTVHALYGYNFNLGEKSSDFVNRHSITVRLNVPFFRSFKNVIRKPDQENDYN